MLHNFYNKFRRITSNQLYFPEIDGIRFLAITFVVLFHIHGYFIKKTTIPVPGNTTNPGLLETLLSNGGRGVELFFVLSGFILCLPFAHHYINQGKKVSLKKYYLRRLTRLEPPYFIAMTGIFFLQIAMKIYSVNELLPHFLASLIYSHGIIYHHVPVLTVVVWSLEVEIQFYILAPLFFSLLALRKPIRRTALLVAIPCIILIQNIFPPTFHSIYGFAQYFFTGILLADLYVSGAAAAVFNKKWMALVGAVALVTLIYMPLRDSVSIDKNLMLQQFCFPFVTALLYYAILKNDILRNIFSYKLIPIIGGMCYSIYLLHYTIIAIAGKFTIPFHITSYYLPNLALQIVLLTIPILLLSALYYYFVERPFMSRKWTDMLLKKDKKSEEINAVG